MFLLLKISQVNPIGNIIGKKRPSAPENDIPIFNKIVSGSVPEKSALCLYCSIENDIGRFIKLLSKKREYTRPNERNIQINAFNFDLFKNKFFNIESLGICQIFKRIKAKNKP